MKKAFVLIYSLFFCATVFFANDLSIGLGGPSFNAMELSIFSTKLQSHIYFGKKNRFGLQMTASVIPLSFTGFSENSKFSGSFAAGPCINFHLGQTVNFTATTGIKYSYKYADKDETYNDTLKIQNDFYYHVLAFDMDLQFKFWANKKNSLILGIPFSVGSYKRIYRQTPESSDPNSSYKTLSRADEFKGFTDLQAPYLLYCRNF